MSDNFTAEAYRAYIADSASSLELKSIDIEGMTAEEIYDELVKLIPYFISRKLDCYLAIEFLKNGVKGYNHIFLCSNSFDDSGNIIINGRWDYSFSTTGTIKYYPIFIDEDKTSSFSQYTITIIVILIASYSNLQQKIWYR